MSPAWLSFLDEIARWREQGRPVDFWWRDDDACRPDPALSRLVALATTSGVPLALAVIPQQVDPAAFKPSVALVSVLQHGVDHRNRAGAGEKKTEFAASESVPEALARLASGRERLGRLIGEQSLPVLVPPWNRISAPQLVGCLADAGYRGLSTFGARSSALAATGMVMVNTHVDIIDWRGSRAFVGEGVALAQATRHLVDKRTGVSDAGEATGWLTHHAVHDQAAWAFMALLFERTVGAAGVRWRSAAELFEHRPAGAAT